MYNMDNKVQIEDIIDDNLSEGKDEDEENFEKENEDKNEIDEMPIYYYIKGYFSFVW